ncbi:MAG: hypothetical protein A2499_13485 [Stygiobacter sp. RIFOXYC12_FULL_38_8]|nr:MAG: hypothetical protein A2X62_16010 [Stygiobacter sp. GWC2_38_9]OGU85561.1 MAG: hypothetical protein A2279_06060 [Stygiobacter sp. RIFOXYA12_FULL_38_9]OGV07596.1 MAG: hypothetical protein A2299_05405 [Stygiobacter sp. RIFOXYB2_FULL_37_11]OGV10758.1 MAG: hypothetical protein A2237_00285 [Stygiobacter sp. RIFOXYA2_FULL_38_8]OGV12599.1 MAG: hypothetical protein A2440_15240 [Stygiobacter sp. RIFOXYC2_FULL_38_25]OGV26857.1 MAG: hypothetical protein A2499_13485 [Stygiobacter sp. RIFOXYC12_FULL_
MKKLQLGYSIVILSLVFLLTSCMPGEGNYHAKNLAGFFTGVWHGWIAPFSLVMGLFDPAVRVYEINNTGWWYDFGFYIAIIGGFGGASLFRKKKKD